MRVLFSSTPGYGHVFPMLPLAHAAQDAGHDVLWATPADAASLVRSAGVDATPAGCAAEARQGGVRELWAESAAVPPDQRAAWMFPRLFGSGFTPAMLDDLLPLARGWRPDLLVHEQGELAAPLVGELLGLPHVTHAFGGAVPAPFIEDAAGRVAHLWSAHGLTVPDHAGCFTSLYLDICPPSVQGVPLDHVPHRQALRPVPATATATGDLPGYLVDDGRPLVYLTLGTVANDPAKLVALVDALAGSPVRLLVALGPGVDPGVLGSPPPHVHVEPWVDQDLVLDHCAVVVSHAGSGTFLGALARGLPQLCLPQAADQFRNAAAGASVGAALSLTPDEMDADAVATAVARLLAEDAFRDAAAVVAEEIRAMPSPEEVVERLADLAAGR